MKNRIKELRLSAGLTQEALADLVGTTYQQISRLERSERGLDQSWMDKLGPALGVRPGSLIDNRPLVVIQAEGDRQIPDESSENDFLLLWRKMSFETKAALLLLAKAIANDTAKAG
jgi:transcriptional regulator with XRE-family HTH domain